MDVATVLHALRDDDHSMTREELSERLVRQLGCFFAHHPRASSYLHDSGNRHGRFWHQPQNGFGEYYGGSQLSRSSALQLARAAVALDRSTKPMLALTACLVLEGALGDAERVARATLAEHGGNGLGGLSLLWLGVIAQSAGRPTSALPSYRSAAHSNVAPIRRAALWGGVLCAAANSPSTAIPWFTDRLLDEDPSDTSISFGIVCETFVARSGSSVLGNRLDRIEHSLRGRAVNLGEVLRGG